MKEIRGFTRIGTLFIVFVCGFGLSVFLSLRYLREKAPVVDPDYKVFLIGIDAGDWYLLEPLLEQGRMPNLKGLIDKGTRGLLTTILPTSSPLIWNSIATGKTPVKHGIVDFAWKGEDGPHPYTSNMVREKPIWDLLNEGGIETNVVGWWTTWPARRLMGRLVSSYVSLDQRGWKGGVKEGIPNQTFPEALYAEIAPLIEEARTTLADRVGRIFGTGGEEDLGAAVKSNLEDTRWCLLSDEIFHRAGLYVQQTYPANFFALYLGGVDVIGHRFWKYMEPGAFAEYAVTDEEIERFGAAILDYYALVDDYLGDYVALADENTTFIIVSDHGMQAYPPSSNSVIADRSGAHDRAEPGVVILSGRHIKKGVDLERPPRIYDIAPTVLFLMGMPVDAEMDGAPILDAIEESFRKTHPLRSKPYGPREGRVDVDVTSGSDQEMIERLRALGYSI